jgi:large subunit ribosomal protein L29
MKAEDLKGKTTDELHKALLDARKEQFNARLQRAAGTLENTSGIRVGRRDIARIKTQMNVTKAEGSAAATPVKKAPAKKKSAKA